MQSAASRNDSKSSAARPSVWGVNASQYDGLGDEVKERLLRVEAQDCRGDFRDGTRHFVGSGR